MTARSRTINPRSLKAASHGADPSPPSGTASMDGTPAQRCRVAVEPGAALNGTARQKGAPREIRSFTHTFQSCVSCFAAETAGAISLFTATHFGIPVSTTHTITGAITGVGAANRISAVRWGLAGRIVWAWILTIPAAAGIAGLTYVVLRAIGV